MFAFTVPPLGSAEGFKASLWPKTPIWIGRLRVVSRNNKCAILLEHTDRDGLYASCPIHDSRSVESTLDSSRYFVLRLSDGKGRHALIGLGFNDRTQAFDFKVSLQDWENHNREGAPAGIDESAGPQKDYSIPDGGSIRVAFGGSSAAGKKKSSASGGDVTAAMAAVKLDGPGSDDAKEKKRKKKKEKEEAASRASFSSSSAAASVVGSSSVIGGATAAAAASGFPDFGFGEFDPLSSPKPAAGRQQAQADPFAPDAAPSFGNTDTPFESGDGHDTTQAGERVWVCADACCRL